MFFLKVISIFVMTLFSGGAIFAVPGTGVAATKAFSVMSELLQENNYIVAATSRETVVSGVSASSNFIAEGNSSHAPSQKKPKRKYRTGTKRFKNRPNPRAFYHSPLNGFIIIDGDKASPDLSYALFFPDAVLHARNSAMCKLMPRE